MYPGLAVLMCACAPFGINLSPPDRAVSCRHGGRAESLILSYGLVACCKYGLPLFGIACGAQPMVFQTETENREDNSFFSSSKRILVLG